MQFLACNMIWWTCLSLIFPLFPTFDALSSSSSSTLSQPAALLVPCVGSAVQSGSNVQYIVIGTSHFRCQSANEVASLIEQVEPDGVVIELDPERVIRLTKQASIVSQQNGNPLLFGTDFLAAINTSQLMDIPLFLGDEYNEQTKNRFFDTLLDTKTYSPRRLLGNWFRQRDESTSIDLIRSFKEDPQKLAPLAAVLSLPFLTLILMMATMHDVLASNIFTDPSFQLSIVFSILAVCKVYNNLIADRDDVLADAAINAAKVISSLKAKETIRKRWIFTADDNEVSSETIESVGLSMKRTTAKARATVNTNSEDDESVLPLFTLKRPLERDKIRRLNLFEPRWLKMIDSLGTHNAALASSTPFSKSREMTTSSKIGCVSCTNKFYSAVTINGREGRYADVIFRREGRMAAVSDITEGQRPSGARKVRANLEGQEAFVILDENDISIVKEGYLVMSPSSKKKKSALVSADKGGDNLFDDSKKSIRENFVDDKNDETIKIVVVVGLLHANGVIDRLS